MHVYILCLQMENQFNLFALSLHRMEMAYKSNQNGRARRPNQHINTQTPASPFRMIMNVPGEKKEQQ